MTDAQLRDELQRLRRSMRELLRSGLNLTAYIEGVCRRGGGTKSAMRALAGDFNPVAHEARAKHSGGPQIDLFQPK